jgi:hypothetical protein
MIPDFITSPAILLVQIAMSSDPRLANKVTRLLLGRDIDCVDICELQG